MRFVIVTGISGAGKSSTLKMLEDFGYFCVDNLPPTLMKKFAEICYSDVSGMNRVALGIDCRGMNFFQDFFREFESLIEAGYEPEILFLEASDAVLLNRYKETRRKHPLSPNGRIHEGVMKERELLAETKTRAEYIIDTSNMLTQDLRTELVKLFIEGKKFDNLMITVMSFGFKYGAPADADLMFDVRFLPNPFYIEALKHKTGEDKEVQEYVMQWDVSKQFNDKLLDMIHFLIPHYIKEGKNQLVIAIGCTGGKHRSVTFANALVEFIQSERYGLKVFHRDIKR